jgi:hypothetical protein
MENLSAFVPKVYFEQIPIKNLVSNQKYQRNLSRRHIDRAVADFDLYQVNPVKVSRRNGQNYVFNGQHTIEIIAAVSGSRDTPVWCMVYDDLEYMHEADIFANQQKYVKKLSAYEIFIASIEADNDSQVVVKKIVESCGLQIKSTRCLGAISAVTCLEQIFETHGYHVLDRTMKLVVNTWEGDLASLSANMIRGISHLIVAFGESLKDEIFAERVGSVSAREIARTAKDRRAGSLGYAEAILNIYNKKTKAGLSMQRLYESRKRKIDNYNIEHEADKYDENRPGEIQGDAI